VCSNLSPVGYQGNLRVWSLRATVSEAVRNLGVRTLVPLGVALTIVFGVAFAEGALSNQLLVQERDRVDAGAYVVLVESARAGGIDAARCEAVVSISGVVAAGSVASRVDGMPESVIAQKLPGTEFGAVGVTPGILRVWYPDTDMRTFGGGIVVGREAAIELAVSSGMSVSISTIGAPMRVASVGPDDRRAPQYSRKLAMVRAPFGATDACWIEFTREAFGSGTEIVAGWFRDGGTNTVRTLRSSSVLGADPGAAFAERPQRFAWITGGVILGLTWIGVWWLKRSELGIYRTLGMSRSHTVVMGAAQSLIVGLWAAALGLALAGVGQAATAEYFQTDQLRVMTRSSVAAILLGTAIGTAAPTLISGGSILQQLKDRA